MGLCGTRIHTLRAAAIFYPNFYPKRRHGGAGILHFLVTAADRGGEPECVTSLPSWPCGFNFRRPLQLINNFRFGVHVSPGSGRLPARKTAHTGVSTVQLQSVN